MLNVVFLPGVNNVASLWEPVVAAIGTPINPILLDIPARESVEDIARELIAAVPEEFVLVGHSFGGMVSLALLDLFPERVRGIVLVASRPGADSPEAQQAKLNRAEAARQDGHEAFVLGRPDRVFHPDYAQDPDILAQRTKDVRSYGTDRYVAHQIAMANRPDREEVLLAAGIPKLFIIPGDDLVISTQYQLDMALRVNAGVEVIERTGHMLPAENPQRLGEAIGNWLRSSKFLAAGKTSDLPRPQHETSREDSSMPASLPEYHVSGSGDTTIFMLHGAYGDGRYFANTEAYLANAGYRVVVWNCPGYGQEPTPDDFSIDYAGNAALALVEAEGTATNIVLGHSMGALIAPNAAMKSAGRVHGIILSGASIGFQNRTESDQARFLKERIAPITEQGLTVQEYAPSLLKTMMAPGASGHLVDVVYKVISEMKTDAFMASMKALTEYNNMPATKSINVPTLLLSGEFDTACPPAGMEKLAEIIPDSEYHMIRDAGHYAFAEQADVYHGHLIEFLNRRFPHTN